ncbi:MAG: MarR family winged helix-turn-helix transcriptional regulator [Lachnospiraceae bacterium]
MEKKVMPLMGCVARKHFKQIEKAFDIVEMHPAQHRILMMIAKHPSATQKDIAMELEVSPANVATLMKKLERNGYLMRIVDAEDNRCNQVSLTAKGCEVVKKSREIFGKVDEKMYAGLTEVQIQQLYEILKKMNDNLTN